MTLRNLEGEVQRRTFRADLYYRLAGICLRLPPLRERRGDIPRLAGHFLDEICDEVGWRDLDAAAIAALVAADWPGNVRELRNVIRRAAILTRGRADGRITADALELPVATPFRLAEAVEAPVEAPAIASPGVPEDAIRLDGRTFDEIEREVFSWALRRNAGSRRRAARALAVARSTFCDKVRRYSL
jgi:DNA-binding NtrC family response regulator